MQITADTKELKLLAAELAAAGPKVRLPVSAELKKTAQAIKADAKDIVRRDTGKTADSITFSAKYKQLRYEVGPRWYVGRFLEFGTKNMPAYPFMQPAAERHVADMADRVAKAAADNTLTGRSGPVSSLI